MPYPSPFSVKVLRKALPALLVIALVFASIMFLAEYTEAAPLVILAWIVVPVVAVTAFRRLRAWLGRGD